MDLERLEQALRNAHAAGDTEAARRLAAEIRRLQASGNAPKAPAATSPARSAAPAAASTAAPAIQRPPPLPPERNVKITQDPVPGVPSRTNVRITQDPVPGRAPTPLEQETLRHEGLAPAPRRAPTPLEQETLRAEGILPSGQPTTQGGRAVMPAVTVQPDPSRYGAGEVYRRTPEGPLLYDSPAVSSDGRRPTHVLTEIAARLAPGQTIDEYEAELVRNAPTSAVPATRAIEALQPEMQTALQQMLRDAAAAGVRLSIGETDRPQSRQDALFAQGRNGSGSPVTWTLTSNHGGGRAADLVADSPAGYRWIQENAGRYGLNVLGDYDAGHVELPRSAPAASASVQRNVPITQDPVPSARELGAASINADPTSFSNQLATFAQSAGSMLFGIGTPLTAAEIYARSRLDPSMPDLSWDEAREWAEGRRDALKNSNALASLAGAGVGLVAGAKGAGAAVRSAPAPVKSVFSLQNGQTLRNIGRLAATGAAAAGVTAANEQGIEAAPAAAGVGAVLGPVVAGGAGLAGAAATRVRGLINPESSAIRILAKKLGESADVLTDRFNAFTRIYGRAPRLNEIVSQEAAGEFSHMGRLRPTAGQIFREAEEAASLARPGELAPLVRGRPGTLPSSTSIQQGRQAMAEEAGNMLAANPASQALEPELAARQTEEFKNAMRGFGGRVVPMTKQLREQLMGPDVSGALDPALRRRIAKIVSRADEAGTTPALPVRMWDMVRQDLAEKTGAGSGQIYNRLRDRIRDYVVRAVPEYGDALRAYGQRGDVITGVTAGRKVLTTDTRTFANQLSVGNADIARGTSIGVRAALVKAFSGTEEQAERMMRRLAQDRGLRERVRATLDRAELRELDRLSRAYGASLDLEQGLSVGGSVLKRADDEAFAAATRAASATVPGQRGVQAGAVRALTTAAAESPTSAKQTAQALAENPGLYRRIEAALGVDEANRLQEIGQTTTTAARRMAESTPAGTFASAEAAEASNLTQKGIGALVIATGRASGAMIANVAKGLIDRLSLSQATAKRLAELSTNPAETANVIRRLREAGMTPNEILQLYRDASIAAGITTGQDW